MTDRIDGRPRASQSGSFASPLWESAKFLAQVKQVIGQNTPPAGQPQGPSNGRTVVAKPGNSLWGIAKQYENYGVEFDAILKANPGRRVLHPGDVVIVPWSSPEAAAKSKPDATGTPKGEKIFVDDLFERGVQLANANGLPVSDYTAGVGQLQSDVGVYLDTLGPAQRQAAAIRLFQHDWTDGGPASHSVSTAIQQRGLSTDSETVFANQLEHKARNWEEAPQASFQDQQAGLASDIKAYAGALPAAEQHEALQRLYDRNWDNAGPAQGAIERAGRDLGISLRVSTHFGTEAEQKAREIIDGAKAQSGPDRAFLALNAAYKNASADVRQAIEHSSESRPLIEGAATWATDPLKNYDPATAKSDQGDAAAAMLSLRKLADGAAPELATRLMSQALPFLEAANERRQQTVGGQLIGMEGLKDWMVIVNRIAGAPGAGAIYDRFANLGCNNPSDQEKMIAAGGPFDYPLAMAKTLGPAPTFFSDVVVRGVSRRAQETLGRDFDAYVAHTVELNRFVADNSLSMTPEQLNLAVEDYKKSKGPEWIAREQQLEAAIISDGAELLGRLDQLGQLPPAVGSVKVGPDGVTQQELVNQQVDSQILADPRIAAGIKITFRGRPDVAMQAALGLSPMLRITDRGRKLIEEATTQGVRWFVSSRFTDIDLSDPNSLRRVEESLQLFKDGRMSRTLGVPQADLDEAVKILQKSLPKVGDTPDDLLKKLSALDNDLARLKSRDGIRAFDSKTLPGQLLRFVGVAATGAGVANSAINLGDDASLENWLSAGIVAAGLSQRTIELFNGVGKISDDSAAVRHFGSSRRPAVKLLAGLDAVLDGVMAARSFANGDATMGGLYAALAGGTVMASLGTGTMFGPAGLVVVGVAIAGQWIVNGNRENSKYETEAARQFAAHSGMLPEVANILTDQSGDGHSVMPLLARYAELKGLDLHGAAGNTGFVSWLNKMDPQRLKILKDNLLNTADDFDGDPSKLASQADSDGQYNNAELFKMDIGGRRSTAERVQSGDATPTSAAQIDAVLAELGLAPLT